MCVELLRGVRGVWVGWLVGCLYGSLGVLGVCVVVRAGLDISEV